MSGPFDLTGKVALVTGAGSASGIGFATARLLAELGADVVVAATTERIHVRAIELATALGREPDDAPLSLVADLTDPAAVDDAVAQVREQHGRLDILVNNAGMASVGRPTQDDGSLEHIDPGVLAGHRGPQPRHRLPGDPRRPAADGQRRPDRDGRQRHRTGDGDAGQPRVRRREGRVWSG